jgi:hypothetical protein
MTTELSIVDDYPSGAAFGSDYFSRAARGMIVEMGPDGPIERPEKVVITDRELDYEGRICVGERTIRHLAHAFNMVDGWRVERVLDDNHSLRDELVDLSEKLAQASAQIQFFRDLEQKPVKAAYVSLDGREHVSKRAAMEADAKTLGVESRIVLDAVSVPISEPAPQEVPS